MLGSNKETDIENSLMDTGVEERTRRVRCMEKVTCKLTLPYVKYITKGNLLYGSGYSKQGLCINLEG